VGPLVPFAWCRAPGAESRLRCARPRITRELRISSNREKVLAAFKAAVGGRDPAESFGHHLEVRAHSLANYGIALKGQRLSTHARILCVSICVGDAP